LPAHVVDVQVSAGDTNVPRFVRNASVCARHRRRSMVQLWHRRKWCSRECVTTVSFPYTSGSSMNGVRGPEHRDGLTDDRGRGRSASRRLLQPGQEAGADSSPATSREAHLRRGRSLWGFIPAAYSPRSRRRLRADPEGMQTAKSSGAAGFPWGRGRGGGGMSCSFDSKLRAKFVSSVAGHVPRHSQCCDGIVSNVMR